MLSNCSAIEIIDNKYRIITEERNNGNFKKGYVIKCFWKNGVFKKEILIESNKYQALDKLLDK